MADMTLRETEELISKIRKAKNDELSALQKAWPNPTERQARRLAKLKSELEKLRKHHQEVKKLISKYGEEVWRKTKTLFLLSCHRVKKSSTKKSSAGRWTSVPWTRNWSGRLLKSLPSQGGKLGKTNITTTNPSSAKLTQKRWNHFHLFFIIYYI